MKLNGLSMNIPLYYPVDLNRAISPGFNFTFGYSKRSPREQLSYCWKLR